MERVSLSPREFQVVIRLAKGIRIPQICKEIGISESFSANLRVTAYKKLGVYHNRQLPSILRAVEITMPKWWILKKRERVLYRIPKNKANLT